MSARHPARRRGRPRRIAWRGSDGMEGRAPARKEEERPRRLALARGLLRTEVARRGPAAVLALVRVEASDAGRVPAHLLAGRLPGRRAVRGGDRWVETVDRLEVGERARLGDLREPVTGPHPRAIGARGLLRFGDRAGSELDVDELEGREEGAARVARNRLARAIEGLRGARPGADGCVLLVGERAGAEEEVRAAEEGPLDPSVLALMGERRELLHRRSAVVVPPVEPRLGLYDGKRGLRPHRRRHVDAGAPCGEKSEHGEVARHEVRVAMIAREELAEPFGRRFASGP